MPQYRISRFARLVHPLTRRTTVLAPGMRSCACVGTRRTRSSDEGGSPGNDIGTIFSTSVSPRSAEESRRQPTRCPRTGKTRSRGWPDTGHELRVLVNLSCAIGNRSLSSPLIDRRTATRPPTLSIHEPWFSCPRQEVAKSRSTLRMVGHPLRCRVRLRVPLKCLVAQGFTAIRQVRSSKDALAQLCTQDTT